MSDASEVNSISSASTGFILFSLIEDLKVELPPLLSLLFENIGIRAKHVAFLAGSGYGHAIVFRFTDATLRRTRVRCVIRVHLSRSPEDGHKEMLTYAAVLKNLGGSAKLCNLPKFRSMDITNDNPLGHAYMIMTRIDGQPLEEVCEDLSFDEKVQIGKASLDLWPQRIVMPAR